MSNLGYMVATKEQRPCASCGKPTDNRFTLDVDIRGFLACSYSCAYALLSDLQKKDRKDKRRHDNEHQEQVRPVDR